MKQRMLAQVIEEFGKEKDVQAHPSILKHLKTALSLYVIPKLVSQQDLQKGKLKSSDPFEINITKLDLPCVLITFDEEFDEAVQAEKTSKFTKGNYRSALGRFLKWIKEQIWYKSILTRVCRHTHLSMLALGGTSRLSVAGKKLTME